MRDCADCGAQAEAEHSFCSACGRRLGADSETEPMLTGATRTGPKPRTPTRGSPWGGAFVMILGVATLVGGLRDASGSSPGGTAGLVIAGCALMIIGLFAAVLGFIDYARAPHKAHLAPAVSEPENPGEQAPAWPS